MNRQGDCRVRPDPVQVSLHKGKWPLQAVSLREGHTDSIESQACGIIAKEDSTVGRGPAITFVRLESSSLFVEGFSVKAHFLNAYRKALGAILRCQMIPLQQRSGGMEAFEAFAADKDMCLLGHYLGQASISWLNERGPQLPQEETGFWKGRAEQNILEPCWTYRNY